MPFSNFVTEKKLCNNVDSFAKISKIALSLSFTFSQKFSSSRIFWLSRKFSQNFVGTVPTENCHFTDNISRIK